MPEAVLAGCRVRVHVVAHMRRTHQPTGPCSGQSQGCPLPQGVCSALACHRHSPRHRWHLGRIYDALKRPPKPPSSCPAALLQGHPPPPALKVPRWQLGSSALGKQTSRYKMDACRVSTCHLRHPCIAPGLQYCVNTQPILSCACTGTCAPVPHLAQPTTLSHSTSNNLTAMRPACLLPAPCVFN
jgi:hypothetical protein